MLFALVLPYSQWPTLLQDNMTLATAGQPQTLQLSDGSRIMLNRNSRLRVAYQRDQRLVWLDAGEAYFTVSTNPNRPFYVEIDGRPSSALLLISVKRENRYPSQSLKVWLLLPPRSMPLRRYCTRETVLPVTHAETHSQ
ncbi:MAG: FecR domain-containing protein [Symbiopectobacterium sp.]|uniref:FecR domain-containing protein n=1 Tax=Symbiopectobacterium sp. TaxID=2952789 RepID=UPI0039EB0BA1